MSLKEYTKLINKNMLFCWGLIVGILDLFYILQGFLGLDSWSYVCSFLIFCTSPYILCFNVDKINDGKKNLKNYFAGGFLVFYTFVLMTTDCPLTFVYILPILTILMIYCDKNLILSVTTYALVINVIYLAIRWKDIIGNNNNSLSYSVVFWEIQICCLILSGIFTYKTSTLLRRRDEVMSDMLEDLYTDDLTNIKNIRFMEDNMQKVFNWERSTNISIAFIDIDNFKDFNTLYGHSFGDKVLITAAQLMDEYSRNIEGMYAIRVGGDEFILVGVNKSKKEFYKVANAIRLGVQYCKLKYDNKDVGIKISLGVAHKVCDIDCHSFMELYNKADTRNNIAKTVGKNVIVCEG